MSGFYKADADIEKIARELIAGYHPEVSDANFGYWIKEKTSKSDEERNIVVVAKKVSPLFNAITDLDFILTINGDLWVQLSETERKIKVDSALCCCTTKLDENGDEKLTEDGHVIYELRQPDIVEHVKILDRYGLQAVSTIEDKIRKLVNDSAKEIANEYDDEGDNEQPVSGKGKKGTRKTATGS
jgi:hypothetical protein